MIRSIQFKLFFLFKLKKINNQCESGLAWYSARLILSNRELSISWLTLSLLFSFFKFFSKFRIHLLSYSNKIQVVILIFRDRGFCCLKGVFDSKLEN